VAEWEYGPWISREDACKVKPGSPRKHIEEDQIGYRTSFKGAMQIIGEGGVNPNRLKLSLMSHFLRN
jgi:hypothetical protein